MSSPTAELNSRATTALGMTDTALGATRVAQATQVTKDAASSAAPVVVRNTAPSSGLGAALAGAAATLAACGSGHVGSPATDGVQMASGLAGSGGAEPPTARAGEQPSQPDAARFLSQATFGVRSVDEIERCASKVTHIDFGGSSTRRRWCTPRTWSGSASRAKTSSPPRT